MGEIAAQGEGNPGIQSWVRRAAQQERFAARYQIELHLLNAGHTLNEKIPVLEMLFSAFLASLLSD